MEYASCPGEGKTVYLGAVAVVSNLMGYMATLAASGIQSTLEHSLGTERSISVLFAISAADVYKRQIPFRLDDPIQVFRKGKETVAFFTEPRRIRRDGMLDGVNGQYDPEAFDIRYEEKDGVVTGWPICPAGTVEPQPRSIALSEWEMVLQKGDILMGFHIPGGAGYDPQHLRDDCLACYEFFRKWFPEIEIKGFGSESWLYDPHLAMLLEGRGNIAMMQRQMYICLLYTSGCGWARRGYAILNVKSNPQRKDGEQWRQKNAQFTWIISTRPWARCPTPGWAYRAMFIATICGLDTHGRRSSPACRMR